MGKIFVIINYPILENKTRAVQNKRRTIIFILISMGLLLIPLIAMQFTDEVQWSLVDFIIAAVLLFGTALLLDFVFRKVKKKTQQIILLIALLLLFFLIWAELAVGILGTPFAGD